MKTNFFAFLQRRNRGYGELMVEIRVNITGGVDMKLDFIQRYFFLLYFAPACFSSYF